MPKALIRDALAITIGAVLLLTACSGPIPLDRAVVPQHRTEYAAAAREVPSRPREAWFAWKAEQTGQTLNEVRAADAALSTTKSPFHARTDHEAVSRGAVIYEDSCLRCHGEDARGSGPALLPDHPCKDFHAFGARFAVTLHGGAPRKWFRTITEGSGPEVEYLSGRSRAMPSFEDTLAREQVWLVITYLQSLDMYAGPLTE